MILHGEHNTRYPKITGILWEGAHEHLGMKSSSRGLVPCWRQVRSPSSRQDRDCSASVCSAHRAPPPSPLPPTWQFSFTRRPVPALIPRCSSPAQHPAGLPLLLPEGEHGEQLSALPAAPLTPWPSVCLTLPLPVPFLPLEAA